MHETVAKETAIALKKHRFTTEEYHRIGEAGILSPEQRVELINGEIVEMSPIKSPHSGTVNLLNRLLGRLPGDQFIIGVQNPVELNNYCEPEPDLAVLKFRIDAYTQSHPKPEDVLLLIEVADSSLEKDRLVKLPLYAAAGIPETWIVNLADQQVEVYTQPSEQGYSHIRIYRKKDTIETALIGLLPVADILI